MKKIILFCFLQIPQFISASHNKITLPSKEVLEEKFIAVKLIHFAEATDIVEQLANTQKTIMEIELAFDVTKKNYLKSLKMLPQKDLEIINHYTKAKKPLLLNALLQTTPKVEEPKKASGDSIREPKTRRESNAAAKIKFVFDLFQ